MAKREQRLERRIRKRCDSDPALSSARSLAEYLGAGSPVVGRSDHSWLNSGEQMLIHTDFDVCRYRTAEVTYTTPGYFAIGRPAFVVAVALGHLASAAATRRRADREAAPQWRNYGPHASIFTTSRVLFHLGGRWEGAWAPGDRRYPRGTRKALP